MNQRIAFIGAGNMARSIIEGLLAQGTPGHTITVTRRDPQALAQLAHELGVATSTDNGQACAQATVVVLAVKPQVMAEVCQQLRPHLAHNPLVISVAAGVSCAMLQTWLATDRPIVRCMPNTPSRVSRGVSGLFATAGIEVAQRACAERIMAAVGMVKWVAEENLLDAVTAVSGSGPAYFFYLMEAMVAAGVDMGLSPTDAKDMAIQTAAGAAELAASSELDLAALRRAVTSPGGTTEQAIKVFEQHQTRQIVAAAMAACAGRARTLSEQLSAAAMDK